MCAYVYTLSKWMDEFSEWVPWVAVAVAVEMMMVAVEATTMTTKEAAASSINMDTSIGSNSICEHFHSMTVWMV